MKTTIVFVFFMLFVVVYFVFFCRCIFHGENCKTKSPFFGFFQKSQNMSHGNGSSTFVFLSYGDFKTSYGFYRQRATTFSFTDGRLSPTFMEKFAKENRVFSDFFKKAKTCLMEIFFK